MVNSISGTEQVQVIVLKQERMIKREEEERPTSQDSGPAGITGQFY